jgi:molybdopterin-guanine dinucleotide biosynthesis protein B
MKGPVVGIAGWKNSGKTTLVERLVAELTRRGLRVATVKHAHHDAEVDREGTDSFRHREAGAIEVALVTGARWAIVHELRGETEPSLAQILQRLSPSDLVIVEGYKREAIPKIEVRRREAAREEPMAPNDPHVIAIAADYSVDSPRVPSFQINDIDGIADFIVRQVVRR